MKPFKKILIIRFSSLGDIILSSPLVRSLRDANPGAEIDFLVKSDYSDAIRFNPNISNVIEFDPDEPGSLGVVKKNIQLAEYDLLIDIHNSLRSRYLRWFSNAKYRTVVGKKIFMRFLLVKLHLNFYKKVISVADRYVDTVRCYGIQGDGKGLEVFLAEDTAATFSSKMGRIKLSKSDLVMGFAPTARHFTKRWPQERFIELGAEISKNEDVKILIFGGKNEHDYCEDIAQMINLRRNAAVAHNFAGNLTLLETASAMDSCHIVVSNDSGLMHLASARKRKVVGIFGSTVREFGFLPYRVKYEIVESDKLKCRPCSHIGLEACPKKHFKCMKDIQVDQVIKAIEQLR